MQLSQGLPFILEMGSLCVDPDPLVADLQALRCIQCGGKLPRRHKKGGRVRPMNGSNIIAEVSRSLDSSLACRAMVVGRRQSRTADLQPVHFHSTYR